MMRRGLLLFLSCVTVACAGGDGARDAAPADSAAAARDVADERRDDRTCITGALTGEGLGGLEIGLPVESIPVVCDVVSDSTVPADEGTVARKITVAEQGDTAIAEIDSARVWRIEVADAGIRTADSLGVGTPADSIRRLAGARELTGEGRVYLVAPQHCGLSFQVENAAVVRVLAIGCEAKQEPATAPPSRAP